MSCKSMHIVNNVTISESGGSATLAFSTPVTSLENKERFCMKIPCSVQIADTYDNYIVLITYNGSTIPLMNKYGNTARVKELKKNKCITGYFGTDTPHVISNIPVTYNCGCNNVL